MKSITPLNTDRVFFDDINKVFNQNTLLYINYPFCKNFCRYCVYKLHMYSKRNSDFFLRFYKKEIFLYSQILKHKFFRIHIGGGTPNLIPIKYLVKPLELLVNFKKLKSFVIELIPANNFHEYINDLKKFKVSKIQLGVQTLNEKLLINENRRLSKKLIIKCMEILNKSGINWSVDLIYGLNDEIKCNRDNLAELKEVLSFKPHGFHFYILKADRRNDFYADKTTSKEKNKFSFKNANLYTLENFLENQGYKKVFDEWCIGENIKIAENTLCYNSKNKLFPNNIGIGPRASTFTRIGSYENARELEIYGLNLKENTLPIIDCIDFRKNNLYPIFCILKYLKITKRINAQDLYFSGKLTKNELKEIDSALLLLKRNNIKVNMKEKKVEITNNDYAVVLRLIRNYIKFKLKI